MIYGVKEKGVATVPASTSSMAMSEGSRQQGEQNHAKRKRTSLLRIIRGASRLSRTGKESYSILSSMITTSGGRNEHGGVVVDDGETTNANEGETRLLNNGRTTAMNNLRIVEWNSCESFPDEEDVNWSGRQNASLRRSRASLVFPASEPDPRGRSPNANHGNRDPATSAPWGNAPATTINRYNSVNILSSTQSSTLAPPSCPIPKFASSCELQCDPLKSCDTGTRDGAPVPTRTAHANPRKRESSQDASRVPPSSRYQSMPNICDNEDDSIAMDLDECHTHTPLQIPSLLTNDSAAGDIDAKSIAPLPHATDNGTCSREYQGSASLNAAHNDNDDACRDTRHSFASAVLGVLRSQSLDYSSVKPSLPALRSTSDTLQGIDLFSGLAPAQNRPMPMRTTAQLADCLPCRLVSERGGTHDLRECKTPASSSSDEGSFSRSWNASTFMALKRKKILNSSCAVLRTKPEIIPTQSCTRAGPRTFELRRSKSYSQLPKRTARSSDNATAAVDAPQKRRNEAKENRTWTKRMFRSSSESDLKQKRTRAQLKQTMFVVKNNSCRSLVTDDRTSLLSLESQKSKSDRPRSASTASNSTGDEDLPVAFAEAVWDYHSLNPLELSFQCGDVIAVYCMDDPNAWWGKNNKDEGWFSPSFVRVRVSQIIEENDIETGALPIARLLGDATVNRSNISLLGRQSLSDKTRSTSSDIRSKCIRELVTSEWEYVKTLKDVIEGYYHQMQHRSDMFPDQTVRTIFSNLVEIFAFHKRFLEELKAIVGASCDSDSNSNSANNNNNHKRNNNNNNCPGDQESTRTKGNDASSSIGSLFEKHRHSFEIYSEYCNNHPYACMKLMELQKDIKHQHFFEACRLRQNMISISLDGFLLTPVQKICKYPLQLKELLKHTSTSHEDYEPVKKAWQTMRDVASLINERKRDVETINQLAQWQLTVYNWKGRDLTEVSSELIYKGRASMTTGDKSLSVHLFLFDHQLVICTADSLKKNGLAYHDRIDLDRAEHSDNLSGADGERYLSSPSCSWKMNVASTNVWYVFSVDTQDRRSQWARAFARERSHVTDQNRSGDLFVPMNVRRTAIELARSQKDCGEQKRRPQRTSMVLLPIMSDTPKTTKKITRKLSFDYGIFLRKNRRQSRKEPTNCNSKDSKR